MRESEEILMKVIAKPRRGGKTTELIKLSAETNTYILVANKMRQKEVMRLANLMNITIPYPVTVEDYMKTQFRGSFIKNILIDDVEDVLHAFFYTVAIDAITVTTERTSCEDCISRESVIQIIENKLNPCTDMFKCLEMSQIKEDVEHLPSVTLSRPRGKWIHWTDDYKDYVTCSCCEYGEEGEVLLSDKTPFCPICGADMRESEE